MKTGQCYWRFKGEKVYHYGYVTLVEGSRGLYRMGLWNGDTNHGPIINPNDIEIR